MVSSGAGPERTVSLVSGRMSRRSMLKRATVAGLGLAALPALLAACGEAEPAAEPAAPEAVATPEATPEEAERETPEPAAEGVRGGHLRVAIVGEPPTLDIHQTTATIVALITWHLYEPLFTWDAEFQVIPELAESYEVSDDGLVNTIHLRQGVTFHNGAEFTAADVIASIEHWAAASGLGRGLLEATEELVATDDYTIEFRMTEPLGTLAILLARQNQGCAIYPASVIEAVGESPVTEFIGTGPYQLVEHRPDRYIRVRRFDDYVQHGDAPNGYGGRKAAYVDQIDFIPVPDEAARIAGLQAGDYHYLESIIPDQYATLAGDPNVVAEILPPSGWATYVLNTRSGIMANQTLRQAIQAALDHEPILQAGYGDGFFRLDPGLMLKETVWHSTAGAELYNLNDPERARQLLEEAGYDGAPIRFMTTQEYQHQFNIASVGRQQLEQAGFAIELLVYDWATLVERRGDPEHWDIFTTGISFRVDPVQLPPMQGCNWPGWWCTDLKVELTERLQRETEFEARYDVWEQVQELFYDEVPMIKLGDTVSVIARSPAIQNFVTPTQLQPAFWNVWLEE